MPRAPRARALASADAIRLFAEHHIVAVRKARRNGEIVAVKHAAFGWLSPTSFYALQEFHRLLPQIVEGGYRIKAALWGMQLELFGFSVPVGGSVPAYAASKIALAIAEGDAKTISEYSLAMALPFGDIWILMRMLLDTIGLTTQLIEKGADLGFFGLFGYVWGHPELGETIRRLFPF